MTTTTSLSIAFGIEIFYPAVNGVITATMNLIHSLKAMGHNPFIVTPQVDKSKIYDVVEEIPVYYIPSSPMRVFGIGPEMYPGLRAVSKFQRRRITQIFKERNCEVAHITGPWLTCKNILKVARKEKIPTVHTFHTNLYDDRYIKYAVPFAKGKMLDIIRKGVIRALKPYMKLSNVITTPGQSMNKELHAIFPHHTFTWIPNGIDISAFEQNDDALLKAISADALTHKGNYGIFVGRIGQEKSIDILLHALQKLFAKVPNFIFFVVGSGPFMQQYADLAKDLRIAKRVFFLGSIANANLQKSGIVKYARFFASASVTEVQSMTVIEAICARTPLVLADHTSMKLLAEDAALYAQPHDADDFCAAMHAMLTDPAVYQKCKVATDAMALSFDGREVAKKFLRIYESLVK